MLIPILAMLSVSVAAEESSFAVIVNNEQSIQTLSVTDLKRIYQNKMVAWPDGGRIEALDLESENTTRSQFSRKIFNQSSNKVDRGYLRRALSGKGQPPRIFSSEEAVIAYVRSHPNAIGYVKASLVDDSIKVVEIIQ